MGSKAWRNLSVLVFAGSALVGCTNTNQKDTTRGATNGFPPGNFAQTNQQAPAPQFPGSGTQQPFPTNPNPALNGQVKPSYPGVQPNTGFGSPASNFGPANQPGGGAATINGTSYPAPGFNPPPPSIPNPNAGFPQSGPVNPSSSFAPSFPPQPGGLGGSPSINPSSGFGASRTTTPPTGPGGIQPIDLPSPPPAYPSNR